MSRGMWKAVFWLLMVGAGVLVAVVLLWLRNADETRFVREYLRKESGLISSLNKGGTRTEVMPFVDGRKTLRIVVFARTPADYACIAPVLARLDLPSGVTWQLQCDNQPAILLRRR